MTKKDKKRKLRGLLAVLEPEKKQEILVKNVEDDLKDVSRKVSEIKDQSNEVFDLQIGLEVLRNNLLQKIAELPTYASLNEMREAYTTLLKYVETGVLSSIVLIKNEVQEVSDKVSLMVSSTKVEELERRIIELSGRGGGSIPLQVSAGGVVANTRYAEINFIGATSVPNNTTRKTDITTSGSGIGAPISVTGTVNDSNVTFTAASSFTYVNVNGAIYRENNGFTKSALSITLDNPVGVGGDIFCI